MGFRSFTTQIWGQIRKIKGSLKNWNSQCLYWLLNLNRKGANLNGSPPANYESGVVFPTQAAWVHVGPQTDIIPQHICDPLFCTDIIYFNSLKKNQEKKQTLAFFTFICVLFIGVCDWSLTTLLAQAMRLARHWILVMEPSPSWRTDVFQRFNQFFSYRSNFERENRKTFKDYTVCISN